MLSEKRLAVLFGDCDNGGASRSADYDNGIWQHTLGIQRVPLEKSMTDEQIALWCKTNGIDVLLCTMWGTFVAGTGKNDRGVKTLKSYYPELKVIGIVDEPLVVDITSRFGGSSKNMEISKGYVDGISDFDGIFCLVESELAFYSSFNKNVAYVGLPFPDDKYPGGGYSTLLRKDVRKEKQFDDIWIGLGVGGNAYTRWERNYLVAFESFKKTKELLIEAGLGSEKSIKGILLSWTEKSQIDVIDFIKTNYRDVMIQVRSDMATYLHFLQSCDLVINPCIRDTPQRINGECAYFGVPIVSSFLEYESAIKAQFVDPDNDESCFPVIENPFDVQSIAENAFNILKLRSRDEDEFEERIEEVRSQFVDRFGYESMRSNFSRIMKEWGICDSWQQGSRVERTFL